MSKVAGVEGCAPRAVGKAGTHEACRLVEQVFIELGAARKILCIVFLAHQARHVGSAIVVIHRLERRRYRLGFDEVGGQIAILHVGFPVALQFVRHCLCLLHGLEGTLGIKTTETFVVSLGHD